MFFKISDASEKALKGQKSPALERVYTCSENIYSYVSTVVSMSIDMLPFLSSKLLKPSWPLFLMVKIFWQFKYPVIFFQHKCYA